MREQIITKIEEIYLLIIDFIEKEHPEINPFSLFEGKTGAALFFYQYAHYKPEKKKACYEIINQIMEEAFQYISETPDMKTSYCDGITGILWLTQFLRNQGVMDMKAEDIPEEIIRQLSEHSTLQTVEQNNPDLLHGGFGFWAFLLESTDLPDKGKWIREQLKALDKIKLKTAAGCNWKVDLDIFQTETNEKMIIDPITSTHLGLAHGTSFILILLAKTNIQGHFKKETETLIHEGLAHLHSLKLKESVSTYTYPMVVLNGVAQSGSRLAWCNGDLCVATAFWLGWKATKKEAYKKEALDILRKAKSMEIKKGGTQDAGLCHGTAGISQLFRRFYWETSEEEFAKVSNGWIQATLEMANYKDGYAGFKTYRSETYGGPHAEYGFLSGISGIGTVLLSALSKEPTQWDRVLQIC